MSNPFAMKRLREDDITVICLEGYLDAHTAPQFEAAIQAEVDAGMYRLIVDCRKLDYISSAGLGVFMGFVEEVRESGGDIKICGLTPKIRDVFDILGFPEIFDLVEDIPAARKRLAAASGAGEPHGND